MICASNYHRTEHCHSRIIWMRLLWVPMALYAVAQVSAPVCLAEENLADFETFVQLNQKNYKLIQTGMLSMRYAEYRFIPEQQLLQQREKAKTQAEQIKIRFLQDPNLSDKQRSNLIQQVQESYQRELKRLSVSERRMDLYRTLIFDVPAEKCKVEKEPADANVSEPVSMDESLRSVSLTSQDGIQINYRKDLDRGSIHTISISAARLPSYFGAYLGIITPRQFRDLPANHTVSVSEDNVDGRDVVVYEIAEIGRDTKLRIYADPAIGYRYRQIEGFHEGKVVSRTIAKHFRIVDGIAFPTFHENISYSADPNHPMSKKVTYQIRDMNFNRVINPDVFKIYCTTETVITHGELLLEFKPCPDNSAKLGVEEILEIALERKLQTLSTR